ELKEASREIWLLHCAGRFLGQGQLDLLLEQAGQRGFQGAQEDMVILFSDIRSFTSISEQLAPCDLIQVLNDYLSHMTRCIERFGGIVDKFIGDAVMALFPPDESGLSGAERASRAALMMRAELEHFNRTLPEDMPRFEIGVGLHTGQVVVGLIGSPQKRSYTAIGDPVNTASRLEGMTKALGAGILVSRELCEQLPADTFLLRPLGRFRPKGRDEAVEVFDLMLEADGSLDALEVATEVERCQTMLAELYNRHFAWATEAFLGMAEGEGDTAKGRGYRFLADHARDMVTQPPPVAWGGEITLTEK
ncbi:MAG: adenylate/guanylate cyclase domain-containing protein, partial [Gammaproteobacteria bacterium]|nr:adenylate/guanylate cyclase domain-containing protein [Gammaproteobacteria bacterium]